MNDFIELSAFWHDKIVAYDERRLRSEFSALPPFSFLSTYSLTRVVTALYQHQHLFFKKKEDSLIRQMWSDIRAEWYAEAIARKESFSSNTLCSAFETVALFEPSRNNAFFAAFRDATYSRLPRIDMMGLAETACAFAVSHVKMDAAYLTSHEAAFHDKAPSAEPRWSAKVWRSYGKIRHRPAPETALRFYDKLSTDFSRVSPQDACNVLSGSSTLHLALPEILHQKINNLLAKAMDSLSPKNFVTALFSNAVLAELPHRPFLSRAQDDVCDRKLLPYERARALWAFAVYSVLDPKAVSLPKMYKLIDIIEPSFARMRGKDRIACFLGVARFAPERAPQFHPAEGTDISSSRSEARFRSALIEAGVSCSSDPVPLAKLAARVDCAVDYDGKRVFIEYDGPHHTIANNDMRAPWLNGSTRLMSALINQFYPENPLVRIPSGLADDLARRANRMDLEDVMSALPQLEKTYTLHKTKDSFVFQALPCPAL